MRDVHLKSTFHDTPPLFFSDDKLSEMQMAILLWKKNDTRMGRITKEDLIEN